MTQIWWTKGNKRKIYEPMNLNKNCVQKKYPVFFRLNNSYEGNNTNSEPEPLVFPFFVLTPHLTP